MDLACLAIGVLAALIMVSSPAAKVRFATQDTLESVDFYFPNAIGMIVADLFQTR
jgi:hypothetical protein